MRLYIIFMLEFLLLDCLNGVIKDIHNLSYCSICQCKWIENGLSHMPTNEEFERQYRESWGSSVRR